MRRAIVLALALGTAAGCQCSKTEKPAALARVNGEAITADQLGTPQPKSANALRASLEGAIDSRLAAEEARRRGLAPPLRHRVSIAERMTA